MDQDAQANHRRRTRTRATRPSDYRVIDGTLLGIDSPEGERAQHEDGAHVLYYSYEISGVVYESSQDVKQLQRHVRPENCRLASAISVRYDPRDHTNSMIVAESWSGLRKAPAAPRLVLQRPLET